MDVSDGAIQRSDGPLAARAEADAQLKRAAHAFLYIGDVDRVGMQDAACEVFRALCAEGVASEVALAHVKAVTYGMMAGSLRVLDDQSYPWLRDSLVGWMIACYF